MVLYNLYNYVYVIEPLKEIFDMNNGSKPSNIILNAVAMPYFSLSIAKAGIAPVSRVAVGPFGMPFCAEAEISVVGMADGTEFLFRTDFVKECFHSESYGLKRNDSFVFELDTEGFTYNNAFLASIDKEIAGEIYVKLRLGDKEYITSSPITLLPANVWLGLEGEPSVLCKFINLDDENVGAICKNLSEEERADYTQNSKKTLAGIVRKLYKQIKERNIIYTRPVGYTAASKQTVRSATELFGSGSVLATPLEISLLFAAAAQRCGFDTSLLFVRTTDGEINVLCGVYLVSSPIDIPVCENAEKLTALVDAGDMLIVDPSVFAAAQNTSFAFACETTAEGFVSNPRSLVCMIDVKSAEKSMGMTANEDAFSKTTVKNGVAKLYSSLVTAPAMQYMSGMERSEFEEIPLLYTDFSRAVFDTDEKRLVPLESNVCLEDFAAIDKDFSSVVTMLSPMAKQHFSTVEKAKMSERLEKLKSRISKPDAVTGALKEEALYNTALRMTFGKNKREPYFALGYVKITDKLTELVKFAPVCLVKAKLRYSEGSFYIKQVGKPIVNKVFIRNALKDSALGCDSFMKSLMPEDKKEIFDMFENIRQALEETDDRHVYEIIREVHLVNLEIDDYVLWSNLALERNKLAMSDAARCVFGEEENRTARYNREYVPAAVLSQNGTKAVCSDENTVVTGVFTKEKEDVFYAICSRSVTEGKSMLVVTDDEEQSEYAKRVLEENGVSDCVMNVTGNVDGNQVYEKIKAVLEKYGTEEKTESVGFAPKDLTEARKTLDLYFKRINKTHSLGMSLKNAVSSYLYSCKGIDGESEIYVDEKLFENSNGGKLEELFGQANRTVAAARKLCEKSGLESYTPIKNHPLYAARPARIPTAAENELFKTEAHELCGTLSFYRDVFSEISDFLKIDEREIKSIGKLAKLNELLGLVLSSRELDVSDEFINGDIARFTRNKRIEAETKLRMSQIEKQLDFFGHEIFEDVELLLKGEEYDDREKGFIKKFMGKRGEKDILLQYVEPSDRGRMSQHKTSEIFALLYEYKACVVRLRENGAEETLENVSAELAEKAEKASSLLDEICTFSDEEKRKRLSGLFKLICIVPADNELARKIAMAKASLGEKVVGTSNSLKTLSAIIGIEFDKLVFENGILSFDGLSKYLSRICDVTELVPEWLEWLSCAERTKEKIPALVEFLEERGALDNAEEIVAKSILCKACERIKEDMWDGISAENLGRAKDRYAELLKKAAAVSASNVDISYSNAVSHLKQLITNENLEQYASLGFRTVLERDFKSITKLIPIMIVTKNDITGLLPLDCMFDNVVCLDKRDNDYTMLPALGYGKRATIINMSRTAASKMTRSLAKAAPNFDLSGFTDNKDPYMFTWLNSVLFREKCSITVPFEKTGIELIRMNGTFDRTTGRTNKAEAELSLIKCAELCVDKNKFVAITAFTKEQCEAIDKMLHLVRKKNRILSEALNEERICVCTPDRLYMKKYNCLVVSACFGQDREGRIGWDFGYAGRAYNEEIPEAYISISDKLTEKTYFLTSLNVKDSRLISRTGNNAAVFNGFCEMMYDGKVPVYMKSAGELDEDSIISGIMSCIVGKNQRVFHCRGKLPILNAMSSVFDKGDLFVLADGEAGISIHDELLLKQSLCKTGMSVTTLSPFSLAGKEADKAISEFKKSSVMKG